MRAKIFDLGGDQLLDGGIQDLIDGGGTGLHWRDKCLMGDPHRPILGYLEGGREMRLKMLKSKVMKKNLGSLRSAFYP